MIQDYIYVVIGSQYIENTMTIYAIYLNENRAYQHKEYLEKLNRCNYLEVQKYYILDSVDLPKLIKMYQFSIGVDLIYKKTTLPRIKDTKTLNKKSIDKLSTEEREKLENSISTISNLVKKYSIFEVDNPEIVYLQKDKYIEPINVPHNFISSIKETIRHPYGDPPEWDKSISLTFIVQSTKSKKVVRKKAQQSIQSIVQYLNNIGFERIDN